MHTHVSTCAQHARVNNRAVPLFAPYFGNLLPKEDAKRVAHLDYWTRFLGLGSSLSMMRVWANESILMLDIWSHLFIRILITIIDWNTCMNVQFRSIIDNERELATSIINNRPKMDIDARISVNIGLVSLERWWGCVRSWVSLLTIWYPTSSLSRLLVEISSKMSILMLHINIDIDLGLQFGF